MKPPPVTDLATPDKLQDILDRAVQVLVASAQPRSIILFGSYARGDSSPSSDIDLLVIEDGAVNRPKEMVRLRRALLSIPIAIDVLVYSTKDVEERGDWLGTPLREALVEGRVLYAAS